jgi:hypothetical protein
MGAEGTRKRQWEADNRLIGPASRALAAPTRAQRRRLPSLHGTGFGEEERGTDSEIDNVLGGIKSVPPEPLVKPVIAAADAAHAPSASELPVFPHSSLVRANPPNEDEQSLIEPRLVAHGPPADPTTLALDPLQAEGERPLRVRRKRQVIVLTAVCAFGAIVFALAAARRIALSQAAPEGSQRTVGEAPTPAPTVSSFGPAVDGHDPATPTVPSGISTAPTPAAAQKTNAASRRSPRGGEINHQPPR